MKSTGKDKNHTYRFAVFGRRNSGKTVFLTSLSVRRARSSSGADITYADALAPVNPMEKISSEIQKQLREIVKDKYDKATLALGEQQLPEATEIELGFPRYRLNATYGARDTHGPRRSADIEIIDFAGEFLERDTNQKKRARDLRNYLRQMDGLLIFAEAPFIDSSNEKLLVSINALRQAFATLIDQQISEIDIKEQSSDLSRNNISAWRMKMRAKRLLGREEHIPVVVMVTKWDRRAGEALDPSPEEFMERHSEYRKWLFHGREPEVDYILKPELDTHDKELHHFYTWLLKSDDAEEHRQLIQALSGVVGALNIEALPVSVFGKYVTQKKTDKSGNEITVEVPPPLPLPSLNVVEPFEFLIQRADANDLERARLDAAGNWKYQIWRAGSRIRPSLAALMARFRGNEERKAELLTLGRGQLVTNIARFAAIGVIAPIAAWSSSAALDSNTKQDVQACLDRADSIVCTESLDPWLDDYRLGERSWLRVISYRFYPQAEAGEHLTTLREKAEAEWAVRIAGADPTTVEARRLAERYLQGNRSGPTAERARNIAGFQPRWQGFMEWRAAAEPVIAELDGMSLPAACTIDEVSAQDVREHIDRVRQLQSGENAPDRLSPPGFSEEWQAVTAFLDRSEKVVEQGEACWIKVADDELWEVIAQQCRAFEFGSCIKQILDNGADNPSEARAILGLLPGIVDQAEGSRTRSDAGHQEFANDLEEALVLLGSAVPPETLVEDVVMLEKSLGQKQDSHSDKWECQSYTVIYNRWINFDPYNIDRKVADLISSYKGSSHSKSRSNELEKINNYIAKLDQPMDINVNLEKVILYKSYSSNTTYRVLSANQLVGRVSRKNANGVNITIGLNGIIREKRLSDALEISIRAENPVRLWGDDLLYEGTGRARSVDSARISGIEVSLTEQNTNRSDRTGSAFLRISPDLPPIETMSAPDCAS